MKKEYIKPDMTIVGLKTRNKLLQGSNQQQIYNRSYRSGGGDKEDWEDL